MRTRVPHSFVLQSVRGCLCAIACLAMTSDLAADSTGRPLTPRTPVANDAPASAASRSGAAGSLLTTCGALGLVVMLFMGLVRLWKKNLPPEARSLSSDVLEVLGRHQMSGKLGVQLIRVGGRILVVGISEQGLNTLAEITDADEVEHLASACRAGDPPAAESGFRALFEKLRPPQRREAVSATSVSITTPTRLSELQGSAHE